MRSAIIQPLSPADTHWSGRSHYFIDTAALLLAGADPASIEAKEPENVTVGEAWREPAFTTASQVWRERLVRTAMTGDLAVSIDSKPGTVGVWRSNGRWSPLSVCEAARLENVFEVRSQNIFFVIDRKELARWLESEGGTLPFWLADSSDQKYELKSCKPNPEPNDAYYVAALRLAWAGGAESYSVPKLLKELQESGIADVLSEKTLRRALKAERRGGEIEYPETLKGDASKAALAMFIYAACCHGKQLDDAKPAEIRRVLAGLLRDHGLPLPKVEQWAAIGL
ncbi:hypothetical protein LPL18_005790 [Halomonas sp. CUBES01]|uniref:hypothetical protein n=1 Tax=Halomonas sp. CUBES01 TaxID=2897340 RepID=UPI001E38DCF4|nr:hypothetical protein [Halomonas sp. CUBES01]MEC4766844.1 hypothetical protein [Halomonas sp. CUBES01]